MTDWPELLQEAVASCRQLQTEAAVGSAAHRCMWTAGACDFSLTLGIIAACSTTPDAGIKHVPA